MNKIIIYININDVKISLLSKKNLSFIPIFIKNLYLILYFINKILYINKIIIYFNIKLCQLCILVSKLA